MIQKRNQSQAVALLILFLFGMALMYLVGRPAFYIWVMDAGDVLNDTNLVKMCPTGGRLHQTSFGQSGEIGLDPARNLLWAPELNDLDQIHYNQVVQVDMDGKIIDRFQGYRTPVLAVDPSDGSVWLPAWNADELNTLVTKIASNGKPLLGVRGFSQVYSVALDPRDGSLWAADGTNRTLTHISAAVEKLFERQTPGFFFSNSPDQIAIEPESGNVWFTTAGPGMIHKIAPDGRLLFETGGFISPVAVTINPRKGNVWVADYDLLESGAIVKLSPQGEVLLTRDLPAHARSAAVNPFDGTLWVGVDGELMRYDDEGRIKARWSGFRHPAAIAFAASGMDLRTDLRCTLAFYADLLC